MNCFFLLTNQNNRWQNDALCDGAPYPKVFDEFKKTLGNYRRKKYGKAPENGREVLAEFEKESVRIDFAYSLLKDRGQFFNDAIISDRFEYCVFSSAKSISLILENTVESERFFTLDATFYITPYGVWEQTLILQINFGSKVSEISPHSQFHFSFIISHSIIQW